MSAARSIRRIRRAAATAWSLARGRCPECGGVGEVKSWGGWDCDLAPCDLCGGDGEGRIARLRDRRRYERELSRYEAEDYVAELSWSDDQQQRAPEPFYRYRLARRAHLKRRVAARRWLLRQGPGR